MTLLANGKETVQLAAVFSAGDKSKDMSSAEPNAVDRLNWLIHLQHVRGETAVCKELIRNEIKRSVGRNEFAYFKQGAIFREEGRVQEALDSFQMCMKLNPENVENIKEVGRCLYDMRRFRLSLEAYLEAERLSKSPDWQILHSIGQCLMRLGEIIKAKEYAQKAVQIGKHEAAYTLLIKILTSEGDSKAAVSACNAAIESCPDSVGMLTESGLLYLKIGQTQHAFERLSSALALDPLCVRALLGVGCITQSHEEHDVALNKYKVAVSYNPNSVALWNNIGICFHSKQKHIAAISCLKRALWISPMNWRVLFNLGLVHLATHQSASAFNFLCAAVNLRPDVPYTFAVLGCALMELNDAENAIRAFKQAMSLAPSDSTILINSILCLIEQNARHEATELFKKYQAMEEQDIPAPKEVKALSDSLKALLENTENGAATRDQVVDNPQSGEVYPENGEANIAPDGMGDGKEKAITSAEHPPRGDFSPDEV